ncbi:uncharacterized protein [Amphiura filiformis]|uniref:uncharacterized protein n=1 Tax=Amphiura filiformis TaxID=82378 RepID=UPI003B217CF6
MKKLQQMRSEYQKPDTHKKILQKKQSDYQQPKTRMKKLQQMRSKYQKPETHKKILQKKQSDYQQPKTRMKKLQQMRSKYQKPETHTKILQKKQSDYQQPKTRMKKLQQMRSKYQKPETHTKILQKKQSEYQNPETRAQKLDSMRQNYKKPANKSKQITNVMQKRSAARANIHQVIRNFKRQCMTQKPTYTCIICKRLWFRTQVLPFKKTKYPRESLLQAMLPNTTFSELPEDAWICKTCNENIKKGILPRLAEANKLALAPQPPELSQLNTLERHLISPVIPFMKLIPLIKGCQKGIHGQVVCVKADIDKTAKSLPRLPNDESLIRVKLKRKLDYKGHHLYQHVTPAKVRSALNILKDINPIFEEIEIDHNDELERTNDPIVATNTINELLPDNEEDSSHSESAYNADTEAETDTEDNHTDDSILCLAPAEGNRPLGVLNMEAESFPVQFPNGQNTYNEERKPKVSPCRYFNARLFSSDNRFASDPQYIFFAQYATELNQIMSKISIAMRQGHTKTTNGRDITPPMLTNPAQVKQLLHRDDGYRYMAQIRGTPAYWERTLKDLFAMIRQIGIPTWFVTFSAADRRWCEIDNAIRELHGKPPMTSEEHKNMTWDEHCENIMKDPVCATRMFQQRVLNLITQVIQSEAKPIGKVVDYFYRTEFQQRGWPHIHMLAWVEDAPKLDQDNDKKLVEFIDEYVACNLPPESDPELHEIVTSVQTHSKNHTKSCRKTGKICRFNFPKPPTERTLICRPNLPDESQSSVETTKEKLKEVWNVLSDPETEFNSTTQLLNAANISQKELEESLELLSKSTTVYLKRKPNDVWINNYNPHLLRAWNGNMDIQYVLDAYSCTMYIVSYISKAEREMGDLLKNASKEAREGNSEAITELQKLGSVYLTHREVPVMECIYRVCSMPLKKSTRKVIFIQTDPNGQRISLPLESLKICLKMTKYHMQSKKHDDNDSTNEYELQDDLGVLKERKQRPAIIRYPKVQLKKDPERYYMNIIRLYLPHRDIRLKPAQFETYQSYYMTGSVDTKNGRKSVREIVTENMAQYETANEQLDEAWQAMQEAGNLQDAWAALAPQAEQQRLDDLQNKNRLDSDDEFDQIEIPELQPNIAHASNQATYPMSVETCIPGLTNDQITAMLRTLNDKQQQLFKHVHQWCIKKANGENPEPFRIFLSGGAGTGKSHVIKCIRYHAQKLFAPLTESPDDTTVLVVAHMGTAAFNIEGQTICSTFNYSTQAPNNYRPLCEDTLNTLRSKLQHVQILIIDEISMVSKKQLRYIHPW